MYDGMYDDCKCPHCGADLKKQDGFYENNLYWTCTECGENLRRDEWLDEVPCPHCGANLREQFGYNSDYDSDYTCESCGTKLHHEYGGDEWEVAILCPSCGKNLKEQSGYNADYDDDYKCTMCGAHLHRDHGGDYEVVKEIPCPVCGANLRDQYSYYDWEDDYTCEECGAHLHRDYYWEEYEVIEDEEDDDDDTKTHTSHSFSSVTYSSDDDDEPTTYSSSSHSSKPKSYTSSDGTYNSRKSSLKTYSRSADTESNGKGAAWILVLGIFLMIIPIIIAGIGDFVDNGGFNPDPTAIQVGVSSEELKGEHYEDVVSIFEKNGFTNIVVREGNWDLFHKSGTVKSISIDGTEDFKPYTKFSPNALIVIVYYK